MSIFFLAENHIAQSDKINIGIPTMVGINEVTEALLLITEIIIPQDIKKIP